MATRAIRKTITFRLPFALKKAEQIFPAGAYPVVTDEELIEGISFLPYRRVSTVILVPGGTRGASIKMISVDPADLDAAQRRDAAASTPAS